MKFNRHRYGHVFSALLFSLMIGLAGCATQTRNPLPLKYVGKATPVGMPKVRDLAYKHSDLFQQDLINSMRQRLKSNPHFRYNRNRTVSVLALSGGSDSGAFGAGLLHGWTVSRTRPKFLLVTGISTGALMATFAFLGPQYDSTLERLYTNISKKDIFKEKSALSIIFGTDSLADTSPLVNLLAQSIDKKILAAVAKEYKKGRRLFVGTTNLDSRRMVIWNMGAIAASGRKGSLALFRKILLASAAIPVAFPPVLINVEAGGKIYDEMHVDGGVSTQVFFYGNILDINAAFKKLGISKPRIKLYIIRNNQIFTHYNPVKLKLLSILDGALSQQITAQGIGDLYRVYLLSKRRGISFNLAFIPTSFYYPATDKAFDQEKMKRLYQLGFKMAKRGYPWQKYPPGYFNEFKSTRRSLQNIPSTSRVRIPTKRKREKIKPNLKNLPIKLKVRKALVR